ncbi:GTP cyclohydrolase II [Amphritea sp. HPY]|uniref:GTP cyclohydrolase II n=1 Tax=Amphritea sp. HPY TaxID=3421652 RepID=UPI003D7C91B5
MCTETKLSGYSQSVTVPMPTEYGEFSMTVFTDQDDAKEHILLVMGDPSEDFAPIVRIHSECATGDLFGSQRCDCGEQLEQSLQVISEAGCGILIYLRQEGRGIGLSNKLKAYRLQDQGLDTVDANLELGLPVDGRSYTIAASMLKSLDISRVQLLTNNPEKVQGLQELGILVTQRLPIQVAYKAQNLGYMKTKQRKLGHLVSL